MAKELKTTTPTETGDKEPVTSTETVVNTEPVTSEEPAVNTENIKDHPPAVDVKAMTSVIESPEEMEARIRAEVLEGIRKEEAVKDEERIRAQLLAQLRQQKQEEEAERAENEIKALSLFLENPEDDFFVGKLPMIVETKNIHDGQGRRYAGITRLANGMPAFPPPVHFPTESFAKVCFDSRVGRPATTHDIEDRLEMVEQQNG